MEYAKSEGIWPRLEGGEDEGDVNDEPDDETTEVTTDPEEITLIAEGPLKEALTKIWELAESKKVSAISTLNIQVWESEPGFELLSAVGSVGNANKQTAFSVQLETIDHSNIEVSFDGTIDEAELARDFLKPQIRPAKRVSFECSFKLDFRKGLGLSEDARDQLTDKLTRFVTVEAKVEAKGTPSNE